MYEAVLGKDRNEFRKQQQFCIDILTIIYKSSESMTQRVPSLNDKTEKKKFHRIACRTVLQIIDRISNILVRHN